MDQGTKPLLVVKYDDLVEALEKTKGRPVALQLVELPRIVTLLVTLLGALVHAAEQHRIRINNLEGGK